MSFAWKQESFFKTWSVKNKSNPNINRYRGTLREEILAGI